MKTLFRRIILGYAVIAICVIMSYSPMYSISVLTAASLATGVFMVFGTAYSLTVDKPIGKIMAPLFFPERSGLSASQASIAAALGL